MGWICKDGKRYYRLSVVIGKEVNDKGKTVSVRKEFYGKTKKEAEAKQNTFLESRRTHTDKENCYFGIVADDWLKVFFVNDGRLKDGTKKLYLQAWNKNIRLQPIYMMKLTQVNASTLQKTYNDLQQEGVSQSTLIAINKLMRRFYKYLEAEGYSKDYTRSVCIPNDKSSTIQQSEVKTWDDEEASKILNGFDKADNRFRLRFLVVLAYYTGCRLGELLALTYDDFTEEGVIIRKQLIETKLYSNDIRNIETGLGITSPKSDKSNRIVPLVPIVKEELELHRKWHFEEQESNRYSTNVVFTTDNGEYYYRKNVITAMARYYRRVNVKYKGMHTYRHTFASNLCKKGVPIQTAASLLGHENISTTARYYVKVSDQEKREAVNKLYES